MTVYVTTAPHAPNEYHLYADDPDEALGAAYMAGATLANHRPDRSPLHYAVNWQQALAARAAGAVEVDKYAPMEAAARFTGNWTALTSIQLWRKEEGAPRSGPRGKGP